MKRFEYTPSTVPNDIGIGMLDWLRREFQHIKLGLLSIWDMPVSYSPPEKVYEGMLRYADGTEWNPGGGKGVYVYTGTAWVKL
jgi:hypothetical protein